MTGDERAGGIVDVGRVTERGDRAVEGVSGGGDRRAGTDRTPADEPTRRLTRTTQ
jgi:hypothetical protein